MKISRKALLIASILADGIDLVTVSIWGGTQWFPFIEVPVVIMHFLYAGPKAALAVFDMIPGVGLLPLYTIATLLYKDPKRADDPRRADDTVIVDTGVPGSGRSSSATPPPLLLAASPVPPAMPRSTDVSPENHSIYVGAGGVQRGPFNAEQVRQMLRSGEIQPDALCWHEGLQHWESIRNHFAV